MPQPKEGDRQIQKESGGALPKPDLRVLNTAARRGTSYDQDKKGNYWTAEGQSAAREQVEVFIPVVFVLTFAAIAYFAATLFPKFSFFLSLAVQPRD